MNASFIGGHYQLIVKKVQPRPFLLTCNGREKIKQPIAVNGRYSYDKMVDLAHIPENMS